MKKQRGWRGKQQVVEKGNEKSTIVQIVRFFVSFHFRCVVHSNEQHHASRVPTRQHQATIGRKIIGASSESMPQGFQTKRYRVFLIFTNYTCNAFIADGTGLSHLRGAHALQSAGELRVLLLNLELCAGGLGVGKGVDNLTLSAGELGGALEVLEGIGDLALLEEELGHGGDGNVAFGVD